MAGPLSDTAALKSKPAGLMRDRILIFSDHTGSERFFWRFTGTTDELQTCLERWADRFKRDTDWVTIALEHYG
jgi:hypothetical protein